ncbi:cytochrome P450 [Auricularia subglabra TFB-10046 SS5]|nr:cytochrome P450 [Auricularia subglabra TFB-10046 SS5]
MGYDWLVAMHRYGDYWRLHRRAIHKHFNETAVNELWPEVSRLNAVFLGLLLRSPDKFWEHARWLGGANVMSITYGIDALLEDDPYIQLGMDSLQIGSKAGAQGAYLVDVLPIPSAPSLLLTAESPLQAAGTARRSEIDGRPIPEDVIRNSTGVVYFGVSLSVGTMQAFFLAMVLHPDTQRTAQAELDTFLQSQGGRMPQMSDRASLPSVTAVLREVMRKYPPLPLAVPHRLMEDDEYEGMHIPENAFILPNAWAMLHDAEYYPNPEAFDPNRFMGKDGQLNPKILDPAEIAFGFGRRVCPGRYFAEGEVWLMIATTLYCFDIAPAKDSDGVDIRPSEFMSTGVVSSLSKFACKITPRSPAKRALVEAGI